MKASQGVPEVETPQQFANRIRLKFKDIGLLNRALTHRSYLNEYSNDVIEDNERLEFLGDAILDFLVGVWVYHNYPENREGELTRLRSSLVCTEQLAAFARKIKLSNAIRVGRGEAAHGGRNREHLLCDVFEALVGAIYLDRGLEAVEQFFQPFLNSAEAKMDYPEKDPKSLLQEKVQARGYAPPMYRVSAKLGPEHAREFEMEVLVKNQVWGTGRGTSKRNAEREAALEAIKKMRGAK